MRNTSLFGVCLLAVLYLRSVSGLALKQFVRGLSIPVVAVQLSSPLMYPEPVIAANAEAIEIRRVGEEPPQAPSSAFKSKTVTLPNGVQYFDAVLGDGATADQGKSVQFQWVIRRQNGYFVDASSNYNNEPFIYRVGDLKKVVPGLDSAIRGMRVGGVRRIIVPPELAYVGGVETDSPGPIPSDFGPRRQLITIQSTKQTVYFEVKLTKVK